MKTYLIVVETKAITENKAREAAGLIAYHAHPLCIVTGIEGPGGAREAMEHYKREMWTMGPELMPAVFVLYPEEEEQSDGATFGPASHWFDPATLATIDPSGWLIATGRLERLGPVQVAKKGKPNAKE